jgi:hypothetical protein
MIHRSLLTALILAAAWNVPGRAVGANPGNAAAALFVPSSRCIACHNQLKTTNGQDVSIGADWRGSLMANAARDPYWHAGVRRETMDHPALSDAIQDECAKCHMPMTRTQAHAAGAKGQVFAHLPVGTQVTPQNLLAGDGVSCSACHQIAGGNLGQPESFSGNYLIDTDLPEPRPAYGPVAVSRGLATIMRSASSFNPVQASHLKEAAFCATCHTLFTHSVGSDGQVLGELPEQVPYLEWLAGSYAPEMSCQSCHMPEAEGEAPFSSVLAAPRGAFSRHVFRGGNILMPQILAANRAELGVAATDAELTRTAERTAEHLATNAAELHVDMRGVGERLLVTVTVTNLAGHKLPTAYPSRRAWIHLALTDAGGNVVFESGRLETSGAIVGNDNDEDPGKYEPHYNSITRADQVQIYEPILGDDKGAVTTGLLRAARYLKDNRIPPDGFDKTAVGPEVAVHGAAAGDEDFKGGSDRVVYDIPIPAQGGPLTVRARLLYQPIAYRWAQNHLDYDAEENRRFVKYFDALSEKSAVVMAAAEVTSD